jgi:hypothetical protein
MVSHHMRARTSLLAALPSVPLDPILPSLFAQRSQLTLMHLRMDSLPGALMIKK